MPAVKSSTTASGTGSAMAFTLAGSPAVGDLMVAWIAATTPLTIHQPLINATNVQDQWTPVFGSQDAQQHDTFPAEGGCRLYCFYKTANATDATTNTFMFNFVPNVNASGQAGVPLFPTTDFVGILATYQTSTTGFAGLDTAVPQSHRPNRNATVFGFPSVDTNGGNDVFWSVIAGMNLGTPTSSDPGASVVTSVSLNPTVYAEGTLSLYLFGSTFSGMQYPFVFNTSQVPTATWTAVLGLQDSTNWFYDPPFVRMGYPYEGPDQMLIIRYPYHWSFTVLKTGSQLMIGQFFSQDQLNAADKVYYQHMLIPESDRDAILAAGIGGDFKPSITAPLPYTNPWKYVPI